MSHDAPHATGLSGDLGWNEADDGAPRGLRTTLLLLATGAVWGSVWLLGGVPPLSLLVSHARTCREPNVNHQPQPQPNRRVTHA